MKNIVFYIRNTYQFNNYIKPYFTIFVDKGFNPIIFHNNSLTKELSNQSAKKLQLENYDLNKLGTKKTIRLIKRIKPHGIIVINYISIFDFYINRISKFLNVPVIYMEHGILVQNTSSTFVKPANIIKSICRVLIYLMHYIHFAANSKSFYNELLILSKALFKKNFKSLGYDFYLLYAENSKIVIQNRFSAEQADNKLFFSGYPIRLKPTMVKIPLPQKIKRGLYLHQPHVFHKLSNCTYIDEYNFLVGISDICQKQDIQFTIKLHPLESLEKYEGIYRESNIKLVKDEDLYDLIMESDIIFGHFSAALFTAVILKKPILLIKPECYNSIHFKFYEQVGIPAYTKHEVQKVIDSNLLNSKVSEYEKFIKNYIGFENNFQHRVETIVDKMLF